jgi:hypothetical protein
MSIGHNGGLDMKRFYLEPSSQAQWLALILDAKELSGFYLKENLENYLLLTLEHFTTEAKLSSSVLAIDYLTNISVSTQSNAMKLREVGDQCLILSGLFPERALRKHVSLDYFINLGKGAYHRISHHEKSHPFDPELFYQLSMNFVGLMDVLHHMRQLERWV